MRLWSSLTASLRRLARLAARDRHAADLEDEMRLHLDLRAQRYREQGLASADARAAAKRRFGSTLAHEERARDEWGYHWVEQLWQDVRYGARLLRQSPGFAAVAIGAVAIAIGINAGFFTLVDTFMWRPLPVAHPERLVRLLTVDGRGTTSIRYSYSDITAIAGHARTVGDVVGYDAEPVAVKSAAATPAAASSVGLVTGNYFAALGGSASIGRMLSPDDERLGASPAVVISDGYWDRAFGRARDVIARDVIVNGAHATIVGVASASFIGIIPLVPDLWMTFPQGEGIGVSPGRLLDPKNRFIAAHARLRPGYTMQQAVAELSGIIAEPPQPKGTRAALDRITGAALMPRQSFIPPDSQTALMLAPALFLLALILVIACSNLANLLLCRALARQHEIAVRLSLGAGRARLVRQLVTESLLIAAAGAGAGFVLASWTVTLVSRSFFDIVPTTLGSLALTLHPSWRVVAYTIVLACVSSVTFGLVPALHATTPNLTGMLKGDDAAGDAKLRRSRMRDTLVAAQVAGSVVLIVAAGILTRGVQRFALGNTGLNANGVTLVQFGLAPQGHLPPLLAADRDSLDGRVAHLAGVRATARALQPPFTPWHLLHVRPYGDVKVTRALPNNRVTPGYFDVVGQRIVSGRAFTSADSASGASVAVVTEAAARALWPRERAVGQSLRIVGANGDDSTLVQVVGVAADAHSGMLWDSDDDGYVFQPLAASDFAMLDVPLLVRGDHAPTLRAVSDAAAQVDRNAPLETTPLIALHDQQVVPFRYAASITASVAALGFALALIGLYGVVAFAVRQRRREIAVHVAVGAGPGAVLRLILRRELRLILAGLLVGLVLAAGESKLIDHLTLPVPGLGVSGLLAVAAALLCVATLAALIPAASALRIAPMQVLRQE